MRLVIWTIEIHSIPTRREENLGAEAIRTIHARESTSFWIATGFVVVKAIVADSLRGKVVAGRALEWITSDHSKAFREGQ